MMDITFRRVLLLLVILAGLSLLGACAPVKYTMHVDPDFRANKPAQVWPAAPEAPRYRYVGQLLGEDNFEVVGGQSSNFGTKLLYWLVGLFEDDEKITLKRPQTGITDEAGRVYVTDISNQAVFVFDQASGKLLVWSQADLKKKFISPIGIAHGAAGQILVADADLAQVFRLDTEGKPVGSFGEGLLTRPTGLARDAKRGLIYVADTHAHDIKVFDDAGKLLRTVGSRGEGDGELNFPTHLVFSGDKLYVTDTLNARVQIFHSDGRAAGRIGKRGLNFGDLVRPKGVAVDGQGNVYVVESYYDQLLIFNQAGDFLMPIGGTGQEIEKFYLPAGVWSDVNGIIYVADMFNGRIVMFQILGGV